jgi:hypothetical protein
MLTLATIQEKLCSHIGCRIRCPLTRNKGAVGLFAETILGIPHSPRCLDCSDGELKVFPIHRDRHGVAEPKETIAVTMLDREALVAEGFLTSRAYRKMNRMLCVPYERFGEEVVFYAPTLIELDVLAALREQLMADYDAIRSGWRESGSLTSAVGTLLQTRTKGKGHGSTSRAFYLRKEFAKKFVALPQTCVVS